MRRFIRFSVQTISFNQGFKKILQTASINMQWILLNVETATLENAFHEIKDIQYISL